MLTDLVRKTEWDQMHHKWLFSPCGVLFLFEHVASVHEPGSCCCPSPGLDYRHWSGNVLVLTSNPFLLVKLLSFVPKSDDWHLPCYLFISLACKTWGSAVSLEAGACTALHRNPELYPLLHSWVGATLPASVLIWWLPAGHQECLHAPGVGYSCLMAITASSHAKRTTCLHWALAWFLMSSLPPQAGSPYLQLCPFHPPGARSKQVVAPSKLLYVATDFT